MGDLVTVGDASLRISPAATERFQTATDVRMHVAGTEAAVAVAASQLGTPARWLSKLSATSLGQRVVSELHEHGTGTGVAWSEEGRQGLLFREAAPDPREEVRIVDRIDTAAATMTPGELRMDLVQSADAVFVAGSTMALSGTAADTAEAVLRAGGSEESLTAFDLDYHPAFWDPETARETLTGVFDAVDVLFADEDDLKTVLDETGDVRELAHMLSAEYGFGMVVLNCSDEMAMVYQDGVIHDYERIETETVDESGQHPALIGAFLSELLRGNDADRALAAGVATAALARTIPGTLTPVDRAEVNRLIDRQRGR